MNRLYQQPFRLNSIYNWADESDVAAALIRTAFLIVLIVSLLQEPDTATMVSEIAILISAIFNLVLFTAYLRNTNVFLRRPLAILIDIILITVATQSFNDFPHQRDQLVALYYLVVMIGAIWMGWAGSISAAIIAGVMNAIYSNNIPFGPEVLIGGQTPGLLLVAVTSAYIVKARDRERLHAANLENEMAMARTLQQAILPAQLPKMNGVSVAVDFHPARIVGGDLYDFKVLDDHRLLFILCDMAGKSVYGLFHLSLVHSHIHAACMEAISPAQIATQVNRNVYSALQPNSYAALFIGIIDTQEHTLTFVNCGHIPPLLHRQNSDEPCEQLMTNGIVIGALPNPEYKEHKIQLLPGDCLVCVTDGIIEARNKAREEFGTERLCALLTPPAHNAIELAEHIVNATNRFSTEADNDDRTVVVLCIEAEKTLDLADNTSDPTKD